MAQMMAFVCIVSILATFLLANVVFVVATMIRTKLAFERAKKQSRGLKSCDGFSPLFGHIKSFAFRPNVNMELAGMHQKYGKTFLAMAGHRPFFSTIDLDLIKFIAVDECQLHSSRIELTFPIKELIEDDIITTRNWRPIRKALAPALRPKRFKTPNVTREIQNSINKLIEAIERKLNDNKKQTISLNADDYFHRYSLDLVLNCFYKQDNLIDFHGSKDELVETIDEGLKSIFDNPLVAYTLVFSYLNPLIDWLIWHFTKLGRWRRQVMQFISLQTELNLKAKKQLKQEQQEAEGTSNQENVTLKDGTTFNRNMIDHFIDQYHLGRITKNEYFNSSFFLFGAADKTSAEGLASILYYLALNEDKQEKLRQDVQVNGSESEYLLWVINESLRLSPPAPVGCSRIIERDIEIEGGRFLVPAGAGVLTSTYAIHRLKEYWGEDANEFRPERFAKQKSFHPCQFMPFGGGARQCPGKEFALHETKLVVGQLLMRYKFTAKRKQNEGFDAPFFVFTCPYEHVNLQVCRV